MIRAVPGRTPRIHRDAFVDPAAQVIGDVTTNVEDCSVLHVTPESPCIVGDGVTIGHRCVVYACTVMNNVRIGVARDVVAPASFTRSRAPS